MIEKTFNLIRADNGAVLKCTDGLEEEDVIVMVKEGKPDEAADDSFGFLVSQYFTDYLLEYEYGGSKELNESGGITNYREFKVTIKIERIK